MALVLALARHIPAADAAMKQGKWEKKKFLGEEVRGKVLGLAGLGRIGQEVARRAAAFGMRIIAHDPFISEQVAADLGVELVSLDDLFARADYLSLHMPSTPQTRTAGQRRTPGASARRASASSTPRAAISSTRPHSPTRSSRATSAAPRSTCSTRSRRSISGCRQLPQVVATPHIAASTREGQELVGVETAAALRDFLKDGVIRNAVNFPSVSPEEFKRLQPFVALAERLGTFIAQMNDDRIAVGERPLLRRAGSAAQHRSCSLNAVLVGLFKPILSTGVTAGQRRAAVAAERGIEVVESRSTRPANYTEPDLGEAARRAAASRWVEGAVFEHGVAAAGARSMASRVEAPLEGTMIVMCNTDQPGVIGDDRHRSSASTASTSPTSRSAAKATAPSASSSSTKRRRFRRMVLDGTEKVSTRFEKRGWSGSRSREAPVDPSLTRRQRRPTSRRSTSRGSVHRPFHRREPAHAVHELRIAVRCVAPLTMSVAIPVSANGGGGQARHRRRRVEHLRGHDGLRCERAGGLQTRTDCASAGDSSESPCTRAARRSANCTHADLELIVSRPRSSAFGAGAPVVSAPSSATRSWHDVPPDSTPTSA